MVTSPHDVAFYRGVHSSKGFDPERLDGHERLGSGMEAVVIKSQSDPSVIKIVATEDELQDNAYMQYILLSKKHSSHNPYLPRVESIKHIKSRDKLVSNKDYYIVNLEQLQPLQSMSVEELDFLLDKIFVDKLGPVKNAFEFGRILERAIARPGSNRVKDKNFGAVSRLITKLATHSTTHIDVHEDNVMVRLTPYGPQLVITDPVINSQMRFR